MPSAHIFLKNLANSGTFSNEVGEFRFNFSSTGLADTLVVSVIGYKTYFLPISSVTAPGPLLILLSPAVTVLDEVIVTTTKNFAVDLVKEALNKLDENLPKKQYLMEVFYRELALRDCTYVRLVEAAASIQDYGYGSSLERQKIKVTELRKSEDYLTYGMRSKLVKLLFGEDNQLFSTIGSDFLRRFKDNRKLAVIDEKPFIDQYQFSLDGYSAIDSDSVAIISFHSDESDLSRPYYEGKVFVKLVDKGVLRFEYGMVANPKARIRNQESIFYKGKFFFLVAADYRFVDGRYYLSRITKTEPINFDAIQGIEGQQYAVYDLSVLAIYTKKSEFDRIRLRDSQKSNLDLYSQEFSYNSAFWESYNYVKINPLLKKASIDLERKKTLEQQFQRDNE